MNTITTPINLAAIRQTLQVEQNEAEVFFQEFLNELVSSQLAITQHYDALCHADTDATRQTALTQLERAVHKLKGSTCYGQVPILHHHCCQLDQCLQQQIAEKQADVSALTPHYQSMMAAITEILTIQSPIALNHHSTDTSDKSITTELADFLTQWDNTYRFEVVKLSLFQPEQTAQWSLAQKQQFCRLFYHARGHFYKFLQYNLGHLTWLDQQDWEGKWSGFSAYERLDNIDYHHLELLVRSFGITGKGLAFFKVHNKADHFDRTYETLTDIWQQQPEKVKTAFDFIGHHQLAMWQWLSDTNCNKFHGILT